MGNEDRQNYRIFIASPGDVAAERIVAFKVIDDLNEVWRDSKYPAQLEPLSWEESAHSGAGKSQEVIKQQIPIETCDIFIAILWKRFGTPTETNRPEDNRPYLSGTQQEFEEAYKSWKRPGGRPMIMLYRKDEDVPSQMSPKEINQLKRVNNFFRQCDPNGKHPVLVKFFKANEFENRLRRELPKVVSELLEAKKEQSNIESSHHPLEIRVEIPEKEKNNRQTALSLPTNDDPEILRWLDRFGLKENPFQYPDADYGPSIPAYFVPFPALVELTTKTLMQDRKTWVVYGEKGSGKTTLRKFLASQGKPRNSKSNTLCIEYNQQMLEQLTPKSGRPSEFRTNFFQSIYKNALANLSDKHPIILDKWKYTDNSVDSLAGLSNGLREGGIQHVLCLIDSGKDVSIVSNLNATLFILDSLLPISPSDEICFRYFLPIAIKDKVEAMLSDLSPKQYGLLQIEWNENTLKDLISKRMLISSKDQTAPYRALGELCTDDQKLSRRVDIEIVREANGNPRESVLRANNFIVQAQKIHVKSRMSLVLSVASALADLQKKGEAVLLTFWGSKGIGKTTLLQHIADYLQINHQITIVNIGNVGILSLEQITKTSHEKTFSLPKHQTSVILLDNLDELLRRDNDSRAFFDFERETILPLIEKGNILIIASSQIELNQWREDDVRMRQVNYQIPVLTLDEVTSLTRKTGIKPQGVFEITFGQPKVASWLLETPTLTEKEIAAKASEYFLEGIPNEARRIAGVICLLPIFNIYLFREILNKYAAEEVQYVQCLTWIKEYIRRGLVSWDVSIGSYRFTDSAVRRLLARQVLYADTAKFDEIQGIACDYFQAQAKSPGYLHMHLVSAVYHRAQTGRNRLSQDVGKACLEWVQVNINAWLSARWGEVLPAWESGAAEQAVREEISNLIGVEYFDAITHEIEKVKQMMEVTQ